MPRSDSSLAIVVLGGSRGIGRAIVERALAEGHKVVAGARAVADLTSLRQSFPGHADRLCAAAVDVGDEDSLRAFFQEACEFLGRVDVVVNNAAREGYGRAQDMPLEMVESIIRTNLLGVILGCRQAAHAMGPGGHIINIGSEVAYRAVPLKSVYCATKFAVRGFSDALELELAPLGIRVSQVHPGWVDTGLHEEEYQQTGGKTARRTKGMSAGQVAQDVASLWRQGRSRQIISPRARFRAILGEMFPSWARWRTRRAFAGHLDP